MCNSFLFVKGVLQNKMAENKRENFPFGNNNKVAVVSRWDQKMYVHINDNKKNKTITFSWEDFVILHKKFSEIKLCVDKLDLSGEAPEKTIKLDEQSN